MRTFFNNVFSAAYVYYSNPKLNVYPRFCATLIVVLSQVLFLFLLFAVIKKITAYNAFMLFTNKAYLFILLGAWVWANLVYYNKKRSGQIVSRFEEKSEKKKKFWGAVAIISIVSQLTTFALLLKK